MRSLSKYVDSPLAALSAGMLVLWLAVTVQLALRLPIDYSDGFNFLLQSRSLTDSQFSFVSFSPWRPRGFVGVLVLFDLAYRALFSSYPPLEVYHLLMVGIALAYVLVWRKAATELWGRATGDFTAILLMSYQLLLHYSVVLLADILTGAFVGLTTLIFLRSTREMETGWAERRQFRYAILLGIAGGLTGATKHHWIPFLPVLLASFVLVERRRVLLPWALGAFGFFVATMEILLRVLSGFKAGLVQQLTQIFREVQFVQAGLSHAPSTIAFYPQGLLISWGPLFWFIAALSLVLGIRKIQRDKATLALGITFAGYFCLITWVQHREMRFLLPLVPALLAVITAAAVTIEKRATWIALWASAMIFPLAQSYLDLRGYYSDPIYRREAAGWGELWNYFKLPALSGQRCDRIDACTYSVRPRKPFEFADDIYYRSYDLSPHYSYYTKLPVDTWECQALGPERFDSSWAPPRSQRVCYVYAARDGHLALPHLIVVKNLGMGLSEREATRLETIPTTSARESVHCKTFAAKGYSCWSEAKFFASEHYGE